MAARTIKVILNDESETNDIKLAKPEIQELHVTGKQKETSKTMMQVDLKVAIKNKTYIVDQIPETDSLVVQDARRDLGVIDDIEQVNMNFRRVGVIANISYFAAVATGNKGLQVGAKELGFEATKICHAADNTMQSYVLTCATVNETFYSAITYLLENDYARALIMISSLEGTAQGCVDKTNELISTIDEVSKSKMLSKDTSLKILQEGEKTETYEKEQRKKELELRHVASEISASGAVEKKTGWQSVTSALAVAGKHFTNVVTSSVPKFFVSVGSSLLGLAADNEDSEEKKKEQDQKRQDEKRRKMAEAQTQQLQLKMDLDDLKKGIKEAENNEKCLHILNGELFKMRAELLNMKSFFLELALFCNEIKKSEEQIKSCMSLESSQASGGKKVDCKQLFESDGFKCQLVNFQAKWVALKEVCMKCRETLNITKKELHDYIERNPTKQEAKEQLYAMIEAARNI